MTSRCRYCGAYAWYDPDKERWRFRDAAPGCLCEVPDLNEDEEER